MNSHLPASIPQASVPSGEGLWKTVVTAILGVAVYTWAGWGNWGFCVLGDYCLDMADALRVYQGDIPYRDFIPTYGALHMFLVAPLFGLGRWFFPAVWLLTSLLIALQLVLLALLARRFLSPGWLRLLLTLAIATVAFAPINSNFILGYSPSGFLGSFLLTAVLFLLFGTSIVPRRWSLAGIGLGLLPFTKMDLGLAAVAMTCALLLVWGRHERSSARGLALGFFLTWSTVCIGLLLYGASFDLLWGSTTQAFGAVGVFKDSLKVTRFQCMMAMGVLVAISLLLPVVRPRALQVSRFLRRYGIFLLPTAIFVDLFRSQYRGDPAKCLVVLNWTWFLVWTIALAFFVATVIRWRSLRPLRFGNLAVLPPLLVTSGMAFLRVYESGWYPFNYYQPAILLLGVYWLARQSPRYHSWMRAILKPILGLGLLLLVWTSFVTCWRSPFPSESFRTPFGNIGVLASPKANDMVRRILSRLPSDSKGDSLLCNDGTSFYVLTGMRSAGFYTNFGYLAWSGKARARREQQALHFFSERRCTYVLHTQEGGDVHKRFGVDYGREILAYIQRNYEVIDRFEETTLYRRKPGP